MVKQLAPEYAYEYRGRPADRSMMNRRLALTLILAGSSPACAPPNAPQQHAPQQPGELCRGTSFDADAPPRACMVKSQHPPRAPSPGALTFHVVEPATCRSGEQATFTLEMQNATPAPITVDFQDGCLNWDTQADDGKHSTLDSECGGLCAMAQETLRVTLEPGGVVHKKVSLTATMQRVTGEDCKEQALGPLPPGRYRMTITLPWTDRKPIPGNDQARASRVFETPLIVTP